MSKLVVNALCMGLVASFALGLTACNRQASADASNATGVAAADSATGAAQAGQPAPPQAGEDSGYAQVVSVVPVNQPAPPQQVCHDEVVNHTVPPKDRHQIAGTVIGAVAGGLLGSAIGHGRGNTAATVVGAVGGGYAGKKIEESNQHANVQSEVVHRCTTVAGTGGNIVGYDVTYVYNGVTHTTRMDHDPGNRVKVEQSVSVVSDAQ